MLRYSLDHIQVSREMNLMFSYQMLVKQLLVVRRCAGHKGRGRGDASHDLCALKGQPCDKLSLRARGSIMELVPARDR